MKKKELTKLLIKAGWIICKRQNGNALVMLIHPSKFICYRTSRYVGPTKSFFIPTKESKQWLTNPKNQSALSAYDPSVYRYISVGDWARLKQHPTESLIIDEDEFLAFNYGV